MIFTLGISVLVPGMKGGLDRSFIDAIFHFTPPFYILPIPGSDSTSVAIDMSGFFNRYNIPHIVMLGSGEEICNSIKQCIINTKLMDTTDSLYIGFIGANGAINTFSSDMPIFKLRNRFSTKIKIIRETEVFESFVNTPSMTIPQNFFKVSWDYYELDKFYRLYLVLKNIIKKYKLDGLMISCLEITKYLKTTGCLALAKLDEEGYLVCCGNDLATIPAVLIAKSILKLPCFIAHPYNFLTEKKSVDMAGSYLSYNICPSYQADTEGMSRQGLCLKGNIPLGPVTLLKISGFTNFYFCLEANLTENIEAPNVATNAVRIVFDNYDMSDYSLPIGKKIIIIPEHQKAKIDDYLIHRGFTSFRKPKNPKSYYLEVSHKSFMLIRDRQKVVSFSKQVDYCGSLKIGTVVRLIDEDTGEITSIKFESTETYNSAQEIINKFGKSILNYDGTYINMYGTKKTVEELDKDYEVYSVAVLNKCPNQ